MTTELALAAPICCIHGVPEPDLPGDYRACGECWHVFRSVWDLLSAERAIWNAWVSQGMETAPYVEPDPDRIYSCPLCCHDF